MYEFIHANDTNINTNFIRIISMYSYIGITL